MNAGSPSVPSFKMLHRHDRLFGGAVRKGAFGLVVAAGTRWVSNGVVPGPNTPAFEIEAFQLWVPVGALVVATVCATIAVWRYLWVMKVFTKGATIVAKVEDLQVHDANTRLDPQGRNITTNIYHAVLQYEMHGKERKVRMRLPGSGFSYGLVKGRETEIQVLDEAPENPLIRNVCFGRM